MKFELSNKRLKLAEHCWIAPTANVIGDVTLENESSIWFNAVLRGDIENITVGEGSNVQDNCVLHTDNGIPLTVGSYVTIGHLVMLHGCTIGDNSLIGISATVLNSAVVGKNCIIGANSLVPERKVIPDNSLVMGSPGKVVRQVSDEEVKSIKENANRYIRNWKNYQQNLKKL